MPCGYNGLDDTIREQNAEIVALKQIACKMAKIIKANGLVLECDTDVRTWIRKHDLEDARRIEYEQRERAEREARMRIRAKLTPRERSLLGIK
jgi:hypothetical protein